nr:hypothetical protein [Micromonospora sp. ATA51]
MDRFRLHRAAATRLAAAAGRRPVLVVLDDLHRADADTLDLLTALLAGPEPVTGPVFVVGTFRATEISPGLTATLARLARTEPVRVYLGGLSEAATGEVAGAVVGRELEPSTVRLLHRRSGGNPFFVRELARLLAAEGDAALAAVPAGVRDVIRHRLGQLPEATRTVLRQAAVIGRDVDPEVLAAVAGEDAMLDALDRAGPAGFLTGPHPVHPHPGPRHPLRGPVRAAPGPLAHRGRGGDRTAAPGRRRRAGAPLTQAAAEPPPRAPPATPQPPPNGPNGAATRTRRPASGSRRSPPTTGRVGRTYAGGWAR